MFSLKRATKVAFNKKWQFLICFAWFFKQILLLLLSNVCGALLEHCVVAFVRFANLIVKMEFVQKKDVFWELNLDKKTKQIMRKGVYDIVA